MSCHDFTREENSWLSTVTEYFMIFKGKKGMNTVAFSVCVCIGNRCGNHWFPSYCSGNKENQCKRAIVIKVCQFATTNWYDDGCYLTPVHFASVSISVLTAVSRGLITLASVADVKISCNIETVYRETTNTSLAFYSLTGNVRQAFYHQQTIICKHYKHK